MASALRVILLGLIVIPFCRPDTASYYVNITTKILKMTTLPFHNIPFLLDDSVLIESDKHWISTYENGGTCINVRCSKDTESCFNIKAYSDVTEDELISVDTLGQRYLTDSTTDSSSTDESKYLLLSDICASNQYCDINLNMNGVCHNYTDSYVERESLIVGHECTDDMYWKICGYGKMKCESEQCAAVDDSMLCQTSNDCWPDKYCNSDGQCVSPKKAGETCIEQEECGRTAACYFSDLRKKEGECVTYFTKMAGENVGTYTGHDYRFSSDWNTSIDFPVQFCSRFTGDESAVSDRVFERAGTVRDTDAEVAE
ncbi:MAG: hypothetical protein P4M11_14700 [Candidatus Pacebacteria bacterium]|nr:hypothetical protein [Candidatus Paceibacterota bacterium]